jgi:hypothetical protein
MNVIDDVFSPHIYGFTIYNNGTAAGRDEFYGSWAVTG